MLHGDLAILGLVLVFGCIAFVFGLIYLFTNFLSFMWRATVGMFFPRRVYGGGRMLSGAFRGGERVCPRPGCRKIERRAARFCSQCGARME